MYVCTVVAQPKWRWPELRLTVWFAIKAIVSAAGDIVGQLADFLNDDDQKPVALPAGSRRQTPDCALVIDASGSMQSKDWKPSRLAAAKEAADAFGTRLAAEAHGARVAIVAYGDHAKTYCGLTAASDRRTWRRAIRKIGCLGSTNIRGGLKRAHEILGRSQSKGHVLLLSDGHNTGRCPKSVAKALKKVAVVECVGIGGSPQDVDEALLKEIASGHPDGSKRYRWIGDKERLVQHFREVAGRITRE